LRASAVKVGARFAATFTVGVENDIRSPSVALCAPAKICIFSKYKIHIFTLYHHLPLGLWGYEGEKFTKLPIKLRSEAS